MVPTSTLSWCIGANVPLVWINIPHIKFRHKWLYESFKNSFFYFDIDNNDWTNKLRRFLSLPKEEINKKWIEKEDYRNNFINNHLFFDRKSIQPFKKIKKLMF